jgi:Secretion system C-terminal sorting domain
MSGEAEFISLAISKSGEPYVSFENDDDNARATVMKFDGTNWVSVGPVGFSGGGVCCTSLAFDPSDGAPCVAYQDGNHSWKSSVMKFDGTNWGYVGNPGFSAGMVTFTDLVFSPSDGPYVAYQDLGNGAKATVMKFDSVITGMGTLRNPGFLLYPNPASDKITVEFSYNGHLSVLNLNGQEIISRQISAPKTQVDLSNLPGGVYFVRVTTDKNVVVGKIVKQ